MNAGQRTRTIAASFAVVYLDLDVPSFPSAANPGPGWPAFPTAELDQAIPAQDGSSFVEDRESQPDLRKSPSSLPPATFSAVKSDGTVPADGKFEYG